MQGRAYKLRAELSSPDGLHGIQVRNCFAFSSLKNPTPRDPHAHFTDGRHADLVLDEGTTQYDLIGRDGCPVSSLITPFEYNATTQVTWGEGEVLDMFKFPFTTKVHIQCDVVLCRNRPCPVPSCGVGGGKLLSGAALESREQAYEGALQLLASTTVFVVDEGDEIRKLNFTHC